MASWDNTRWTYEQIINGTGSYRRDDEYRYSEGVHIMQINLNVLGYNCGTPDGKFGSGTENAVKSFQTAKSLTADGYAGPSTLRAIEACSSIESWDNSRFAYGEVRSGRGYYSQDTSLRYSAGVATVQSLFNKLGYNCGSADGKFGTGTKNAVQNYQAANNLTVDGRIKKSVMDKIFEYSVDFTGTNQQVVYSTLKSAGLNDAAIAGFMGNMQAENEFSTALTGTGGAGGICQWADTRLDNLRAYANSLGKPATDIQVQADFVVLEITPGTPYYKDSGAGNLLNMLRSLSNSGSNVKIAADYVNALYERCHCESTWAGVVTYCQTTDRSIDRFSSTPNVYNSQYYLDAPKRRGYSMAFYLEM